VTQVYRLVRAERARDVLSGEGARLYGGRWNPPGVAVVYASESRALAVLEAFVHVTLEARAMRFLLYAITLPTRAKLQRVGSPRRTPTESSREIGRTWAGEARALALVVPSVIVPQETNYVLNVSHPQFASIAVGRPESFSFDERLWRVSELES
jgi:RES domain-containing protein